MGFDGVLLGCLSVVTASCYAAGPVKSDLAECLVAARKVDSCGSSQNVSHWAELFNKTGKAIRSLALRSPVLHRGIEPFAWAMQGIENCHNSWPDFDTGFCPMNFFRTGMASASEPSRSALGQRQAHCPLLYEEATSARVSAPLWRRLMSCGCRTEGTVGSRDSDMVGQSAEATVNAADLPEPRSRPGCWAYPDMSEAAKRA